MVKKMNKICKNPNCDNIVHNQFAGYCQKCSIRGNARKNGYTMDENIEINLGNGRVGYVLKLNDALPKQSVTEKNK